MWILENLALVFMISINYRIPLMFVFLLYFRFKKVIFTNFIFLTIFCSNVLMYWLTFGVFLKVENEI